MDSFRKLEETMVGWYKPAPRLPAEVRKWLAINAWWITLIFVILGAIGVIGALLFSLAAGAALTALAGGIGAIAGVAFFVTVFCAVLLGGVAIVMGGMAINPLKVMQKRGWTLLFWVLLLEVASVVLSNVFTMNIFGLIWGLLWSALGGYFLFEIRGYFDGKEALGRKKVEAKQK